MSHVKHYENAMQMFWLKISTLFKFLKRYEINITNKTHTHLNPAYKFLSVSEFYWSSRKYSRFGFRRTRFCRFFEKLLIHLNSNGILFSSEKCRPACSVFSLACDEFHSFFRCSNDTCWFILAREVNSREKAAILRACVLRFLTGFPSPPPQTRNAVSP